MHGAQSLWAYLYDDTTRWDLLFETSLIVYDILNDDDEDIRELGSEIAFTLMCGAGRETCRSYSGPEAASRELLHDMLPWARATHSAWQKGIARLADTSLAIFLMEPVSRILLRVNKAREDLFEVEKPNLYLSRHDEARRWAGFLKGLIGHAVSSESTSRLGAWVTEGLRSLAAHIEAEGNSALDWTSNSELFALGLQLIHAADVLLFVSMQQEEWQCLGSQVATLLRELSQGKRGMHPYWDGAIEELRSSFSVAFASLRSKVDRIWSQDLAQWMFCDFE